MFTRLLPMRMVHRALSYCSHRKKATFAALLPLSAAFFSRSVLTEAKAISEPEKKAEKKMQITIPR